MKMAGRAGIYGVQLGRFGPRVRSPAGERKTDCQWGCDIYSRLLLKI